MADLLFLFRSLIHCITSLVRRPNTGFQCTPIACLILVSSSPIACLMMLVSALLFTIGTPTRTSSSRLKRKAAKCICRKPIKTRSSMGPVIVGFHVVGPPSLVLTASSEQAPTWYISLLSRLKRCSQLTRIRTWTARSTCCADVNRCEYSSRPSIFEIGKLLDFQRWLSMSLSIGDPV